MISDKEIICPNNLLDYAHKKKGVTAGIVNAGKPLPMLSAIDAIKEDLIVPIFIGDKEEIIKYMQNDFVLLDTKSSFSFIYRLIGGLRGEQNKINELVYGSSFGVQILWTLQGFPQLFAIFSKYCTTSSISLN